MKKVKLMLELNMSIHELIEMIKIEGEVVEFNNSSLEMPNDKYVERIVLFHDDTYWLVYAIFDNSSEHPYWEDMQDFKSANQARSYYNELTNLQIHHEQ